jgi:hypothetical protein
MSREDPVREGVEDARDFYPSRHDVSVPYLIGEAVEKAP